MIVLFDGLLPKKSTFESEASATNLHSLPSVKVLGMYIYVCIYVHCISEKIVRKGSILKLSY